MPKTVLMAHEPEPWAGTPRSFRRVAIDIAPMFSFTVVSKIYRTMSAFVLSPHAGVLSIASFCSGVRTYPYGGCPATADSPRRSLRCLPSFMRFLIVASSFSARANNIVNTSLPVGVDVS